MPPSDSAALVVARFLQSHHYPESYAAFIAEAGLPESAGTVSKGDLTLETLLEEKKLFDTALRFEKLGVEEGESGWTEPVPSKGEVMKALPTTSNILSTTIAALAVDPSSEAQSFLVSSTADRRLNIVDLASLSLHASHASLSDSPILSCTPFSTSILLGTTMSGTLFALDIAKGAILDKRKDHSKYVVACAVFQPSRAGSQESPIVATAGWDNKVHIYRPSTAAAFAVGDPVATLSLPTKPESILLLPHPETSEPILLLSRTDSSSLHYYTLPSNPPTTQPSPTSHQPRPSPTVLGTQNLAPHSNAWVAFTPSALAPHPTDSTLLAAATNSIPHMKVLVVRLLIPPIHPTAAATAPPLARPSLLSSPDEPQQVTQASQARAALATADREHGAIRLHVNTTAPQTAYSTPAIVWRPDGSGVWVNGDDGVVRGVELASGKVVATLGESEGGHEVGSKVRCLAAAERTGEVMVSGGFDQRLVVWRT